MGIRSFWGNIFGSDNKTENEEDLIVKPYDFFIEADERYSDKKTFFSEDIRRTDTAEILESMDLCYDVTNHSGVRRKLQKLFDEVSFEISEFASYDGGRTISMSDTEEIDEHELEITVTISRASGSGPFEAAVEIREASDEEEDEYGEEDDDE